jgi:NAD-dependent dihydropyrimidine dehydrogenase PreA subunit
MAYVIAEPCVSTKDTACVDVCPCDCIHPRKDEGEFSTAPQLYINPDECIDCGACIPVCPVSAIFHRRPSKTMDELRGDQCALVRGKRKLNRKLRKGHPCSARRSQGAISAMRLLRFYDSSC